MATGYLTTDSLIESVKRRASVPDNQNLFEPGDFLAFANEELQIGIVPSILSYNEEYFVWSEDVSLTASVSNYQIPYRAIGGKLRDVHFRDAQGNIQEMTRISPDDRAYFQNSNFSGSHVAYYIQGNDVILVPAVSASPTGSLVFTYYLRPNELVEESRVGIIQSISTGATNTVYTLDALPTGMTTSTLVDIIQAKPGHKTRDFDLTPVAVDSVASTITLANADLPANIEAGDHICFAGECIIPQIPSDLHSVLAQRVAARCLESMGDQAGLQSANNKLAEMEVKTTNLVDNRAEGSPMKVNNIRSVLRSGRFRRGGRF